MKKATCPMIIACALAFFVSSCGVNQNQGTLVSQESESSFRRESSTPSSESSSIPRPEPPESSEYPLATSDYFVFLPNEDGQGFYVIGNGKAAYNKTLVIPESLNGIPVTKIGDGAFSGRQDIGVIYLPDTIEVIGDKAFNGCSNAVFGSTYLPKSLKTIGEGAFERMAITDVVIPQNVSEIGDGAFRSCASLAYIDVDPNNQNYSTDEGVLFDKKGEKLIAYPSSKTKYDVPKGVTEISDYAFYGALIEEITLPEGVTRIGDFAFFECFDLTDFTFPSSLRSIGEQAFRNNKSMVDVVLPEGLETMGTLAFNHNFLNSIVIPGSLKSIPQRAFAFCYRLQKVTMGSGIESIGLYAFDGCQNLTSISIPGSVVAIERFVFEDCARLTSVTFEDGFKSLAGYSFSNCVRLETVSFPASFESLEDYSFFKCQNLKNIIVDPLNPNFSCLDGILYDKDCTKLVLCPCAKETVSIPETVTEVEDHSFQNSIIEEIRIPYGVKTIGTQAFYECKSLKVVKLGDSLEEIGYGAFEECCLLEEIYLPQGLLSIGPFAFSQCHMIEEITIPQSVTTIGNSVFYDCFALKTATIGSGVTSICAWMFHNCPLLSTIYYEGTVEDWGKIEVSDRWIDECPAQYVTCLDGFVRVKSL